jgi:hypothetical protein
MLPETGGTMQKQQSVAQLLGSLQTKGKAYGIACLLPFSQCEKFVAHLRQRICEAQDLF